MSWLTVWVPIPLTLFHLNLVKRMPIACHLPPYPCGSVWGVKSNDSAGAWVRIQVKLTGWPLFNDHPRGDFARFGRSEAVRDILNPIQLSNPCAMKRGDRAIATDAFHRRSHCHGRLLGPQKKRPGRGNTRGCQEGGQGTNVKPAHLSPLVPHIAGNGTSFLRP